MEVALYILSDKYVNTTPLVIGEEIPDPGFEGFIKQYQRIELFNDEKISITSSIQDIADISKSKTDFTQSFTIPASQRNNEIFKHWYESAIDGGFDQRIKYKGYIEIDTVPFREGGFSLSNVKFKNGKPLSYTINFFGNAKNIKDILKEDKLSNLDFSSLNHSYNSGQVYTRITSSTADVAYPLFAHDRIYEYGGGSSNDVTHTSGAIHWNSLFPAISVATILQKINDKYGISFTGAFTNYVQFSKLWMLFKNAETLSVPTAPLKVNFTSKDSSLNNTEVNLTTDEIGLSGSNERIIKIKITPTDLGVPYNVLIYKNGALFNSFSNQIGITTNTFFAGNRNTQNANDKYTIYVQGSSPITFTSQLFYRKLVIGGFVTYNAYGTSQTTQSIINIGSYAPDLKLVDFISGLIKAFNLVVIPTDELTFDLIPLELYYNNGKFNDISENIITEDFEIKKTSMYKNINFKYQKSENILNTKFNELFQPQRGFEYGDLTYEQIDSLESNTFTVDLPFENPLFERKSDSNFLTVTFKNKDLNNYVPKPLLMYDNGLQSLTTPIKLFTSSTTDVNNYRRFSNEISNGGIITLNWGEEVSPWYLDAVSYGLYKRHYSNYLGNIFDIKGRLLNVKCKFNPVELKNIQLNDRIVIRDKRYTINKMNFDLTTGEGDLELLTDYRDGNVAIGNRYSFEPVYLVDNTAQEIEVLLLLSDWEKIIMVTSDEAWINYSLGTYYENTTINVTISDNPSSTERIGYIQAKWALEDGTSETIKIPIIQDA